MTTIWRATCGVDGSAWKVEQDENPAPNGSFCPDCRERGSMASGVLHWKADPVPPLRAAGFGSLPDRLSEAADFLAEEIPPGTQEIANLEGDVRLDALDLYCVNLMREAAEAMRQAMTEETKTPTPADLISIFKLRAKQYAEANGIDPKWTQEQQIAEALESSQARQRELEEAERRLRLQMLEISEHAGAHLCRAEKAEQRVRELEEALRAFGAVAEFMRPLGAFETWPDNKPNSEFIPGSWPTWGDFKRAALLNSPRLIARYKRTER